MPVQLTVRGTDGLRKWALNEWQCLTAVASISAQPESVDEFLAAIRRYQPADDWSKTGSAIDSIQDATSEDGQWCLVDLASRSVVSGPRFELPERRAALQADGDEHGQGSNMIWLDTPADWLFETAAPDWNQTVDLRASQIGDEPRLDGRAVLYGEEMLRLIADRILIAAASGVPISRRQKFNRGAHADWLLTSRDDLSGKTPREWMLKDHEHIGWEMQHRSQQWTMQGFAAPPLDVTSVAYRYAGFGTTEIVLYFDLFRSLLNECWKQSDAGVFDSDQMIEHLATHQQSFWAHPPAHNEDGISCREMIECERRRMPVTGYKTHLDCDCQICQSAADGAHNTTPTFIAIDGHHLELEEEFAFSTILSRVDWNRQQAANRRRTESLQQQEQQPQQQSTLDVPGEDSGSVWQSSFVDWDKVMSDPVPSLSPAAALGFPLAELITSLKQRNAGQGRVDSLDLAFTAFRSADNLTAAQSAAMEFQACLEHLASEFPDLTSQSADLQSRIDEILRKQSQLVSEAAAAKSQPALATTIPILSVVVFRSHGPADEDVESFSHKHTTIVSKRPTGGGLGYLTLEAEDFDRVAEGIANGENIGTAAAVLHFMGPNAADLISQPQDLDYIWIITDNTPYERILTLQVVMRPHLLE